MWSCRDGVLGFFLLKRGELHHFTVTVRVSRARRVSGWVSVRIGVRFSFSFSDRVGIVIP